jgi:hypothetical protein
MHGEQRNKLCRIDIIRPKPSMRSRLVNELPTNKEVEALLIEPTKENVMWENKHNKML